MKMMVERNKAKVKYIYIYIYNKKKVCLTNDYSTRKCSRISNLKKHATQLKEI